MTGLVIGLALGVVPLASAAVPSTPEPARRVPGDANTVRSGAELLQALGATFPALRPRMQRRSTFLPDTWRQGSRSISGLRPQGAAGNTASEGEGSLAVLFPRRASEPIVAEGEGVRVVLRPVGANGAPAEVVDGKLVYVSVHEKTDALHIVGEGWTEEYLHLRDEDAPRRFEYELVEVQGASNVRLLDGEVRFFDDEGRGVVILAPVVVDAAGRRSATAARWEMVGGSESRPSRLVLELDPSGLDYPLVVDPSFATGSMATARYDGIGILLHTGKVLVISGGSASLVAAELYDPATGLWSSAADLTPGRNAHAAVMLRDGRVLVIGGASTIDTTDCQLYDPLNDTWAPAKPLPQGRQHHTATLLPDGRVLVAGGANTAATPHADAWLYDPVADDWAVTGAMNYPRTRHAAVLLESGKILVAGGFTTDPAPTDTVTSEIYDPANGLWTEVGSLVRPRTFFAMILLPDGDVLAAGDSGTATAERFDPGSETWSDTGALADTRRYPSATLLPSGKVLLAGGYEADYLDTTEVYDPGTGQWSSGPTLQQKRRRHSATMLPDGRVLVAGGQGGTTLTTAELIDVDAPFRSASTNTGSAHEEYTLTLLPDGRVLAAGGELSPVVAEVRELAGDWAATIGSMTAPRSRHTATLLHDGRVLLAGSAVSAAAGVTAEIFDPGPGSFAATSDMSYDRHWHTATLLPCGEVLVAGGRDFGGAVLPWVERYNPKSGLWREVTPMTESRWGHTATLLHNGLVLVTAGQGGAGTLNTAELYDPAADSWTPVAAIMNGSRYHHTATLLPSGDVLLVGGNLTPNTAEVFKPGTFDPVAPPKQPRQIDFTATLLPNGRVLVVGGALPSQRKAEIYDPISDTWTELAADLGVDRAGHRAALLLDGRVLIAGGATNTTALIDVGRGESSIWRPVLGSVTNPLTVGTPLSLTGTAFQGHSEGSTGMGYMHSASNYPLVQVRRLDNDAMGWVPVGVNKTWSDVAFESPPVGRPHSGPVMVTVFTSGIPSESKVIALECPPPMVTFPPADTVACLGGTVDFTVAPECAAWQWRKEGVPLVEGGRFTGTRTATLSIADLVAGDVGNYDAVAEMACGPGTATSASATLSLANDLTGVNATPGAPVGVCTTCTGPTITAAHLDGGPVTHQWGYRTQPGGTIIDMPGRTSVTYQINGGDFPGIDAYYLVVQTTPTCGSTLVSNEIAVDVTASPPGDDVQFFTVTSRDSQNVLEWVNPVGYATVRIRYNTGSPCVFPVDPLLGGTLLTDKTGLAGEKDKLPHGGLTNDLTYCYTLFVDTGGGYSTGRSNHGRPFDTGGKVKWAFSTGVFSMTAPTVGGAGVIATSNDNVLHAMKRGTAGGEWPATWEPLALGGPVQSRSPIIPITVGGANPVIYLGAQDGRVYAIDGQQGGAALTQPWVPSSQLIANEVQAAPAGMFTAYGGAYDYLLIGTRNPVGSDNSMVALDPLTGTPAGSFDNGGTSTRIGAINGMAVVDYGPKRVYFSSTPLGAGVPYTLWALTLGTAPVFSPAWSPQRDLGASVSTPVLMNGRIYVGSLIDGGRVHSIDAATGASGLDRSALIVDGPVRGFLFPDRANNDLYFATDNAIWGVHDDGATLSIKWGAGFILDTGVTPTSPVLVIPGDHYLYVGGSDGKLYEFDTLTKDIRSVQLGADPVAVGAPSLDWPNGLIHVGTEAGIFYAVEFPFPP